MSAPLLLVAYQCAPEQGSVSQIGWEWYARLAATPGVTLVTHVRNRAALQAAAAPLAGSDILYIDTEWFAGPLYRLARRLFPHSEHRVFMLASLDYFVFDLCAYWQLRRRLAAGAAWRLLHRVTPVTLAAPTCLGRLGLATVLGPLNCGLGQPPGFGASTRREGSALSRLRGASRLLDWLLASSARSSAILTASGATLASVAPRHRSRCRMMCENGVDLRRFQATPWPAAPAAGRPLRILFVGRLVAVKGLDLLLAACARLQRQGVALQLEVLGDGPMAAPWQALARQLGLAASVHFHGAASGAQVAARMQACHALCLPSVRESGGAVLLEAMACARPVIALGFGGPAELVSPAVGALLPLTSPRQVSADLARTLADIVQQPAAWRRRGLRARHLVAAHYSWPAKIAAARALYQELLQDRSQPCR